MKTFIPLTVDDAVPAMQGCYQEWCSDQGVERSPVAWLMWRNKQLPEFEATCRGFVRLHCREGLA
ncbi:MAG: hypothetical protein F6K00_19715 [Leptolyngbya sp. SIOISBB]|nr:hypothetical protein [Leptolyngbya sp. SIOISBB]